MTARAAHFEFYHKGLLLVQGPCNKRSMANVTKTPRSSYARFQTFHRSNPHVYEKFKEVALGLIQKGYKRLSSKMIIEYIRCRFMMKTRSNDDFKINNNYTPFYTREFQKEYPQFAKIFETRKQKSVGGSSTSFHPIASHP